MALINCSECGHQVSDKANSCPNCGCPIEAQLPPPLPGETGEEQAKQEEKSPIIPPMPIGVFDCGISGKSRGVAALLALFLGALGIHYFYVGKTGAGILFLLLTILLSWTILIPLAISIITLVQAILLFTMIHDEFERKYVNSNSFLPI